VQRVHGPRSVTTARALVFLGDIYHKQGEFDKSLKAFRKAKKFRVRVLEVPHLRAGEAIYRRARGSNHHCVAQVYDKMAQCMEQLGDLAGALSSAMDSHSI
jgi:cytochrome c-type biogenesis protein CcmH/NrfG